MIDGDPEHILAKALMMVLKFPQLLTRLLLRPRTPANDLESQVAMVPATTMDGILSTSSMDLYKTSEKSDEDRPKDDTNPFSNTCHEGVESSTERPPYANGPARIFLHKDGNSNGYLVLSVSRDMTERIQDVINEKRILYRNEKLYASISDRLSKVESAVQTAEADFSVARSDQDRQKIQKEADRDTLRMTDIRKERDNLASRLETFRVNVECTQNRAHAISEGVLYSADLLAPDDDNPDAALQVDQLRSSVASSPGPDDNDSESHYLDPEEFLRQATWERLMFLSKDLRETREQFDILPEKCDEEREAYDDILANGKEVPARSEHDRFLLHQGMRIKSYLINVEKEQEKTREDALVLGLIDDDWGKLTHVGDEFDAQSLSNEEEIAYQQTKDWSHIDHWRREVSKSIDRASAEHPEEGRELNIGLVADMAEELVDIDDWDAKTVDFAQDSVSVVAQDEH